MKRFLWLVTFSFVLLMPFGMHVQGQPKELTEPLTGTPHPPEQARMDLETIGIVSARFQPEVTPSTGHPGLLKAAGIGTGASFAILGAGSIFGPAGTVFSLAVLSVGAGVGAGVGAVKGNREIKKQEGILRARLATPNSQETLRECFLSVAKEQTQYSFVPLEAQGPKTRGEKVTYDPSSCNVDTVLEIGVNNGALSWNQGQPFPHLVMAVGTKLIRIKDGNELYRHRFECEENNAQPSEGVDRGFQCIAKKILEKDFPMKEPLSPQLSDTPIGK